MLRKIAFLWIFCLGFLTGTVLLLTLLFASNDNLKASLKTLLILPEFVQRNKYSFFESVIILPLKSLTPKPIIREVSYQSNGKTILGDLWIPNEGKKHPVVILTIGIEIPKGDERNLFLANIISRSGVAVFVPELPGLLSGRLISDDIDHLINAYNFLENQPDIKHNKIGFLSFCGASTLSITASADPKIADRVAFVVANNLFYSNASIYKAIVSKKLIDGTKETSWSPDYKTVRVLNEAHIDLLVNETDKNILKKYLVYQSENVLAERNFDEIPAIESERLSADALKVYNFLTNKDPSKTDTLVEDLPDSVKSGSRKIDAAPNLSNLQTKVYVIADRGNTYQPYTDSKKFIASLPKNKAVYTETDILQNNLLVSDLSLQKAVTEGVKIFYFVQRLLLHTLS